MTITLRGYANTKLLGQSLAAHFPAMAGKTQVICTANRRQGSMVTVMTNAIIDRTEVTDFIIALSAQAVTTANAIDAVLTPDK